jgi:hypothetical protein
MKQFLAMHAPSGHFSVYQIHKAVQKLFSLQMIRNAQSA